MSKSCFVIMGYGIKNNVNLDLTYEKIIKPCIIENSLVPFPLYAEPQYNAYRCDEISGTISIDYKFVTCLNGSDIVVADISTMNANAIYELGARHALKPRSTILLCAKDKEHEFKFFDITYVPIIFYDHGGAHLSRETIASTREKLNKYLDFAINSTTNLPDNPIQRALFESKARHCSELPEQSIYQSYLKGKQELDDNNFSAAEITLSDLYSKAPSEENLLLLALAKYKQAELVQSRRGLVECINLIVEKVSVEDSTSEYIFGALAAINLRLYNLTNDPECYYSALEYYRRGAVYCKDNLYCPRNYCALLFRIYEVTNDLNIIREYYFTAKHYARIFLHAKVQARHSGDYDNRTYLFYNANDLRSILEDKYLNFEAVCSRLRTDTEISKRQRDTILDGVSKLKKDIEEMNRIIRLSSN